MMRSVAVEIETGKSDFVQNVRQNLAAKYGRIVVVATDKTAFKKIETALAKEGLLVPSRIQVELANKFRLA